jgi:5-methylcytosine-specific restriction endonuclease McrA
MNYKKHYEALCFGRQTLNRVKGGVYYERHHIIPRSLGGSDDPSNLVLLTAREHYIAHLLLYRMAKPEGGLTLKKMAFALVSFLNTKHTSEKRFASKTYSMIREAAILSRLGHKVEDTTNYKQPKSLEHRESIRQARKQSPRRSTQSRLKMRESALQRGDNFVGNHTTTTCNHCNKTGQTNAMLRWHFENCKYREEVTNA